MSKRVNCYVCESCGYRHWTIDRGEGVTPMFIGCRNRAGYRQCGGRATSAMYRLPPWILGPGGFVPAPEWEWYRPDEDELAMESTSTQEHVHRGGLLLRRIATDE